MWREGGIATAKIHGRQLHASDDFQVERDFNLVSKKPAYYRNNNAGPEARLRRKNDGWDVGTD